MFFDRATKCLSVVSVLLKMMACEVASSFSLLKSVMRRELGPVWVGVEVCPEAMVAEEYGKRDC